jgi:hypothetical protein
MKSGVLALALIVAPVALAQQDFAEQAKPKVQRMLTAASCPRGVSPEAWRSFQELSSAGDDGLLTTFLFIFSDPRRVLAASWVAFDSDSDMFSIVSLAGHSVNDQLKFDIMYSLYQHGFLQQVEFVQDLKQSSSGEIGFEQNGVALSINKMEINIKHTYTNSDKKAITYKARIMQSTLRTSTVWVFGGKQASRFDDGVALKFQTATNNPEAADAQASSN